MRAGSFVVVVALAAACGGVDDGGLGAAPPSVDDGVLMAFQGAPPPGPGAPTPFVFAGCPLDDVVEVRFYRLVEDGTKEDLGVRLGQLTRDGLDDEITFADAPGDRLALREADSFAASPFVYSATVTMDPTFLDVSAHTFVARMLNPATPDYDDLGIYFTEHLSACAVAD